MNTCIIIVETAQAGEATVLGALVDSVREVVEMLPGAIAPAPRMGSAIRADYIMGIGKRDERFIIVLDVAKVFSREELDMLAHQGSEQDGEPEHSPAPPHAPWGGEVAGAPPA